MMERVLAILAQYEVTDIDDPRRTTPEQKALLSLAYEISTVEQNLVGRLQQLVDHCTTAINTIERPHAINSLGVVQGSGSYIDVIASKLATLREQLAIQCGRYLQG